MCLHTSAARSMAWPAAAAPGARKSTAEAGIARDAVTLHTIAGVYVSPGPHHYRLRGLPFGWSRVVPLAEEATAHQRRAPRPRETPPNAGALARNVQVNRLLRRAAPVSWLRCGRGRSLLAAGLSRAGRHR